MADESDTLTELFPSHRSRETIVGRMRTLSLARFARLSAKCETDCARVLIQWAVGEMALVGYNGSRRSRIFMDS